MNESPSPYGENVSRIRHRLPQVAWDKLPETLFHNPNKDNCQKTGPCMPHARDPWKHHTAAQRTMRLIQFHFLRRTRLCAGNSAIVIQV
mmetsp:Transcript_31451/g.52048  ORF Transcript_31451/g.52048 Transcript_31451/m.52048 type:complete len:89 (-) Transcript_31451:188-454(-)